MQIYLLTLFKRDQHTIINIQMSESESEREKKNEKKRIERNRKSEDDITYTREWKLAFETKNRGEYRQNLWNRTRHIVARMIFFFFYSSVEWCAAVVVFFVFVFVLCHVNHITWKYRIVSYRIHDSFLYFCEFRLMCCVRIRNWSEKEKKGNGKRRRKRKIEIGCWLHSFLHTGWITFHPKRPEQKEN